MVPHVATCMSLTILVRLRKECNPSPATITSSEAGSSVRCLAGPERRLAELGLRTIRGAIFTSCRNRIVCHTDAVAAQLFLGPPSGHQGRGAPSLATGDVAFSLLAYIAVYAVIYSFGFYYIYRLLRDGPAAATEGSRAD